MNLDLENSGMERGGEGIRLEGHHKSESPCGGGWCKRTKAAESKVCSGRQHG